MDEGESFEEALKRELFEELGIELTEPAPFVFSEDVVEILERLSKGDVPKEAEEIR